MFLVEGAAEGCGEASYRVGHSIHGAVDEIVVFNNKSYFRVTVALHLLLGQDNIAPRRKRK